MFGGGRGLGVGEGNRTNRCPGRNVKGEEKQTIRPGNWCWSDFARTKSAVRIKFKCGRLWMNLGGGKILS